MGKNEFDFDVALSFAGEDRNYVENVANVLRKMGIKVFYDKYEKVSLWGKDLYTHLREIYFHRARYTVIFISKHYKEKLWTSFERESAQARAFTEKEEYILPARLDATEIPGILPTTGYIDLKEYTPDQFAELIKQKIGMLERVEFFPDEIDRIFDMFKIDTPEQQEEIYTYSYHLFEMLKLMTDKERKVLSIACINACPAGLPENVHLNLEYLSRLTSLSRDELLAIFSRINCLSIQSRLYENDDHPDEDAITKSNEIIEFKFEPLLVDYEGNATNIMVALFECIFNYLCQECAARAIDRLDLSVLGSLTGFDEIHSS